MENVNKKEIKNLAFDFGASSGRAMVSVFDGETIKLDEVYRFPNEPVRVGDRFYWDFLRLFHELKKGLALAYKKYGNIDSIGIDTWGVDYGLIDENGDLIGNPFNYRDTRTEGMREKIEEIMSYDEIFKITGNQYMSLNTLYQLFHDFNFRKSLVKEAKNLLFMPDLFAYFLTGEKVNEYTIASTSQMLDAKNRTWATDMLTKLNIDEKVLGKIVMPGTIIGSLTEGVKEELQVGDVKVIAVGSHDTACAVAATPLKNSNYAYLSCGTWSLIGVELDNPIINEDTLKHSFTNEGGVENKIRFLKNINGLWLIQQLKKNYCEHVQQIDFPDIIEAARNAKRTHFIVDPSHASLMNPINMVKAIEDYCVANNQGKPEGLGEIAIAVYNGLTNEYDKAVKSLNSIRGTEIEAINMVGGGIKDTFLCEQTAKKTGVKVIAGPIEASVIGNVLAQLLGLGVIKNLSEGREIVSKSFPQNVYLP